MTSSLPSLFRDWRAAVLLLATACASPDRAAGECGDHVTILTTNNPTSAPDRTAGRAAPTAPAHATPTATTSATEPPVRSKRPCSGPNCSRGSDRFPTPPAPVPTSGPHVKEVAQLLDPVEQPDHESARAGDFTSPVPIRRASSIFHPPRVG
jgi:hypothetical protein